MMIALQNELEELRQDVLKKKKDNLLDVSSHQSMMGRKSERGQRASFVDYVSEVWPNSGIRHNHSSVLTSSSSTITSVAR